jgi:hypothetical protein
VNDNLTKIKIYNKSSFTAGKRNAMHFLSISKRLSKGRSDIVAGDYKL